MRLPICWPRTRLKKPRHDLPELDEDLDELNEAMKGFFEDLELEVQAFHNLRLKAPARPLQPPHKLSTRSAKAKA